MATATSLSRFGITINFASSVEVGTYVNGDQWFLPVTINSKTPAWGADLGWELAHGAQINPFAMYARTKRQGLGKLDSAVWDGLAITSSERLLYDASFNVADNFPLAMVADQSLVCCKLRPPHTSALPGAVQDLGDSVVEQYAVFTCVASAPAAGSFRPGYAGNVKDHTFNVNEIDWDRLGPDWDMTANVPTLAFVTRHVQRPWCEWLEGFRGRAGRSINSCSRWQANGSKSLTDAGYSRGLSTEWSDCMLRVKASDHTRAERMELLIGMIQVAIDDYTLTNHERGTATSTTATTLVRTGAGWTVDEWVGAIIFTAVTYSNPPYRGSYGYVTSNTSDTLTMSGGWIAHVNEVAAATPAAGFYRLGAHYGFFQAEGGHGHGHKCIIFFGGLILARSDMIERAANTLGDKNWEQGWKSDGIAYSETEQFFYVAETSTGRYNYQSPICKGGVITASSSTTLVDEWITQQGSSKHTVDEWIGGAVRTSGGSTGTCTSNSISTLTLSGGWTGGTPAVGETYTVDIVKTDHTYVAGDVGLPEWGFGNVDPSQPFDGHFGVAGAYNQAGFNPPGVSRSGGSSRLLEGNSGGLNADTYRWCCTQNTYAGSQLAIHGIPRARAQWNHDPFLDYGDRYLIGFESWFPNSGGAIIDLASYTNTEEVWYGRGGRPQGSIGTVAYDFWQKDMYLARRSTVVEPDYKLEGYRWRNDDGTEATATFMVAQDADITVDQQTVRLRTLSDNISTLNPVLSGAVLQGRKVGDPDSAWRDI